MMEPEVHTNVEEADMIQKFASAAAILLATITIGGGLLGIGSMTANIQRDTAYNRSTLDLNALQFESFEKQLTELTEAQDALQNGVEAVQNTSIKYLYMDRQFMVVQLPNADIVKVSIINEEIKNEHQTSTN